MVGENIAEVVANDLHIVKILPSGYDSVPEVDSALFSDDVSWELGMFRRFLRMPYIFDDFEDHLQERKPWSKALYEAHGREFWDYAVLGNALKRGNFVQLNYGASPIVDMFADMYCGSDKEGFELLVEGAKQEYVTHAEYAIFPVSIKALHVRKLKTRIHDILKFCEKKQVLQEVV